MDLFRRLARYRREIFAVLILQLVTTLATLYLPDLNADIIDNLSLIHI